MLGFVKQHWTPAVPIPPQPDTGRDEPDAAPVGIVPAAWPPTSNVIRMPPTFWPPLPINRDQKAKA